MIAKIKLNKPAHEVVRSLYGNINNTIIKDVSKYQKKQVSFDVMWTDKVHTAIEYERPDKICDWYMLYTNDLELGA